MNIIARLIINGFVSILLYSCTPKQENQAAAPNHAENERQINGLLDSLNTAATRADFKSYFNLYTDDAIFTGTDATERWNKQEFMRWAKPIFEKGRAWQFTSLQRHIYIDTSEKFAWFDELLNTQMKICRGSGVVKKQGGNWKIQQYILSITAPNEILDPIITLKSAKEDSLIFKLRASSVNP